METEFRKATINYCKGRGQTRDEIVENTINALKAVGIEYEDFLVEADVDHALAGQERVQNLMSKRWLWQDENTPRCCDPSTELYWSM